MNKEEIDSLETYLKDKLPKIEPTIPISTFESVNLDDLMDSIKQFKKIPTSDELLRENKKLRNQLQEKDKIIDKATKYLIKWGKQPDADMYYRINEYKEYTELLETLERGKNENRNN